MFSVQIISKVEGRVFDQYVNLVEIFCQYLRDHEGIRAVGLLESQRSMVENAFNRLPESTQIKKLENFKSYFELCCNIVSKGQSLREKKACLKAFLSKYALSIPDEDDVMLSIDKDTYIEIYDNLFTQVYRSADFLNVTNHSLMALEFCEWFDLFQRSKDLTTDQIEVVTKIFNGVIKVPVFKPIEDHSVKEINSEKPKNSLAEIVLYSPIFASNGELSGILHIFKVVESHSLEFRVV